MSGNYEDLLNHLKEGGSPQDAPGLGKLLEEVHDRVVKKLTARQSGLSWDERDDIASGMVVDALEKMASGKLLESYDPSGAPLVEYLSRFAEQRAIDRFRSRSRESDRAKNLHEAEPDVSIREAVEQVVFRPRPTDAIKRPLEVLGTQLDQRLDWTPEPILQSKFKNLMEPREFLWKKTLGERRNESEGAINAAQESYRAAFARRADQTSPAANEPELTAAKASELRRRVRRCMRDFQKRVIDGTWFPLTVGDLESILDLSDDNAQQVRSRSKRELLTHLTTGKLKLDENLSRFLKDLKAPEDTND